MAPTLPRELVTLVIRELLTDADQRPRGSRPRPPTIHAFQQLRLVARHIKADAHQAWPDGLSHLANNASERMLRADVTTDAFHQGLDEACQVLQETRSLRLSLDRFDEDSRLFGDEHDQHWFRGVKQIIAITRALDSLDIDVDGAKLSLRQLPLFHLRLRWLRLWGVDRSSLVGLDLSGVTTLHVVHVMGYQDGAVVETAGFHLPPRASAIKLQGMELSSDQVDMLGLESNINLHCLDLRGSRLDRPLPAMPALMQLGLRMANLDDGLLPSLASWNTLEHLDLSRNPSTSTSALALATNTSLKRLDMSATRVHDAAVFELRTNTGLQDLIVRACPFTSLAFGLARNRTLRELSLSQCRFTVQLMQQLAGELAGNATLLTLDLSFCSLTDEEMVHFKLEKSSGLRELDLIKNTALSDEGLQPLADSIVKHGLLRELDLTFCNNVTKSFVARLRTPSRTVAVEVSSKTEASMAEA